MNEELKDFQVLDVLCGGTFYKVRHKVTNKTFAWKAFNCSTYTDKEIQKAVEEVKTISKIHSDNLLHYYDTILHSSSKTLYFVLEYNSWQSLEELLGICKATDKYISESFVWYLLRELARVCKDVEDFKFEVLRKCISSSSIFVNEICHLRINCFDLEKDNSDLMRQVGEVIHAMCYRPGYKITEFHYSNDLQDVVNFITDDRSGLRPDVVLYHPTVLANLETVACLKDIACILVSADYSALDVNKCDSEKAELCKAVKPVPRRTINTSDYSPIYSNVSPKRKLHPHLESNPNRNSMSPTLAALALELPGFVPRCRKPMNQAIVGAQKVSEDTFSQQWMTRLIALRQREESLNQRERDIIAKEIAQSPTTKIIKLHDSQEIDIDDGRESNGITLPPMITHLDERNPWVSRRRHRRSGSVRGRRKSYAYEDLDSSLSADNGDESIIVTATKFTKENMPRRNIFPDNPSKKVHFTPSNPFAESDESVTLTFYELDNVDHDGYQLPRKVLPKAPKDEKKDISKFKYLDVEKITSEKRTAMQQWNHSSPSKQPKINKGILTDITNHGLRKTPSKSSLTSKGSNTSRYSLASTKSIWSSDSGKASEDNVSTRTRSSTRQSFAYPMTPTPEVKKKPKARKSLLPFKTPFKFKTSTKV